MVCIGNNSMKEGMKKLTDFLLDCVFPYFCLQCGASDVYFCFLCRQADWFKNPTGIFVHGNEIDSSLTRIISLTKYNSEVDAARLIEDFKYGFINQASTEINVWLKNTAWLNKEIADCDLIIPVPLHRRRFAERGFNQAEIIAGFMSTIIHRPIDFLSLIRAKSTKQQAKLGREKRLKNVIDAFVCKNKEKIVGQNILLVDDVYTTGATLEECAKVLLATGAKNVSSFTLAHG